MLIDHSIIALVIFLVAGFMQGVIGFGFSMLSVPLLMLFLPPPTAVGINLIAASVNTLLIFWTMRRRVQYRLVLRYILVCAVTIPFGVFFLTHVDKRTVMIVLGCTILAITLFSMVFRDKQLPFFQHTSFGIGAAATSGVLAGAFTVPGPPMIVYLYNVESDKMQAKADIQFYFSAINFVILPFYIADGFIDGEVALSGLAVAPLIVLASWLGVHVGHRLPKKLFANLANAFLLVLGVFIIVKHWV
ncbi:MAG: sulfite exporter TauE/SafE family protein [bacterium]